MKTALLILAIPDYMSDGMAMAWLPRIAIAADPAVIHAAAWVSVEAVRDERAYDIFVETFMAEASGQEGGCMTD